MKVLLIFLIITILSFGQYSAHGGTILLGDSDKVDSYICKGEIEVLVKNRENMSTFGNAVLREFFKNDDDDPFEMYKYSDSGVEVLVYKKDAYIKALYSKDYQAIKETHMVKKLLNIPMVGYHIDLFQTVKQHGDKKVFFPEGKNGYRFPEESNGFSFSEVSSGPRYISFIRASGIGLLISNDLRRVKICHSNNDADEIRREDYNKESFDLLFSKIKGLADTRGGINFFNVEKSNTSSDDFNQSAEESDDGFDKTLEQEIMRSNEIFELGGSTYSALIPGVKCDSYHCFKEHHMYIDVRFGIDQLLKVGAVFGTTVIGVAVGPELGAVFAMLRMGQFVRGGITAAVLLYRNDGTIEKVSFSALSEQNQKSLQELYYNDI